MLRALAAALPLLLLASGGHAAMGGDDWQGVVAFASGGRSYVYAFEGIGCGFPLWCWSLAERFHASDGGALVEVPGSASWAVASVSLPSAVTRGVLDFGGEVRAVTWHAVVHSVCFGAYEGPVTAGLAGAVGRAGATKSGPGPDGHYECMPS